MGPSPNEQSWSVHCRRAEAPDQGSRRSFSREETTATAVVSALTEKISLLQVRLVD